MTTIKSFDHKQPILPQLLELERAFEEYQRASGEPVQESLKSALLLRSITVSMRSHIAASLDEDAGYSTLRECVLKFERTQFKWSGMHVFAPDGLFATGNVDAGGQQPIRKIRWFWYSGFWVWSFGFCGRFRVVSLHEMNQMMHAPSGCGRRRCKAPLLCHMMNADCCFGRLTVVSLRFWSL